MRGLYRGMTSPLLGVAGINAVTFGVNAQVNLFRCDTFLINKCSTFFSHQVLKQLPQPDSISSITIAGASAGLIQVHCVSLIQVHCVGLIQVDLMLLFRGKLGPTPFYLSQNQRFITLFIFAIITFKRSLSSGVSTHM